MLGGTFVDNFYFTVNKYFISVDKCLFSVESVFSNWHNPVKVLKILDRHKTISFMPHILAYKNEFYEGLNLYV